MPTLVQLGRFFKVVKFHKPNRSRALIFCPQKMGVVIKPKLMKPKKPNSAQRKIAKVRLSTKRVVLCYIPGIGHNIREFSQVLVRGGHVKDLPGIQYHLIKGKFDFSHIESFERKHSLTKYGWPSFNHPDFIYLNKRTSNFSLDNDN